MKTSAVQDVNMFEVWRQVYKPASKLVGERSGVNTWLYGDSYLLNVYVALGYLWLKCGPMSGDNSQSM